MSTRYVWNRYEIETSYISQRIYDNSVENTQKIIFCGSEPSIDEDSGLYIPSGARREVSQSEFYALDSYGIATNMYPYAVLCQSSTGIGGDRYCEADVKESNYEYRVESNKLVYSSRAAGATEILYTFRIQITQEKGSLLGSVSGTSQSIYPDDGVQGSYWYEYQGSDNIDPASVSIPSSILGGQQISITVTPGTGKVYGGTVSYQYQVNIGAGWTTIATTSATSYQYTVPYGTASIQVRVRAKDNIGFTSSTYVTSSRVNVINNQPPTAPGSIDVTNVVAGQQATITLTAATDPDGTIASYIYERSVDGSAWTQIANVNSLTQTDTISADWGTVAYRACAVDDDGDSGPYVTSSTTVVNSGWVIISGPAADMGSQPKPFTFAITPSISGTTTSDQITVGVTLDGNSIYNEAVAPGTEIELEIDTRLMRTGDHAIAVSATCASYVPAADEYTFTVPDITIPDGGRMDQLEGPDGEVIFPVTIARAVAGLENVGVESKVHPGAYTGSGTYGSGNPNSLALEFEPKLVIIQGTSGRMAVLIKPSGVGISIGASNSTTLNVIWDGESVSWYNAVNASNQMNTSNETYSYTAFG